MTRSPPMRQNGPSNRSASAAKVNRDCGSQIMTGGWPSSSFSRAAFAKVATSTSPLIGSSRTAATSRSISDAERIGAVGSLSSKNMKRTSSSGRQRTGWPRPLQKRRNNSLVGCRPSGQQQSYWSTERTVRRHKAGEVGPPTMLALQRVLRTGGKTPTRSFARLVKSAAKSLLECAGVAGAFKAAASSLIATQRQALHLPAIDAVEF